MKQIHIKTTFTEDSSIKLLNLMHTHSITLDEAMRLIEEEITQ